MATSEMSEKIEGVEIIIGYDFQDPLILWEALQAAGSGVTSAGTRRFPDGNKRLAILGNKILSFVSRLRGTMVQATEVCKMLLYNHAPPLKLR